MLLIRMVSRLHGPYKLSPLVFMILFLDCTALHNVYFFMGKFLYYLTLKSLLKTFPFPSVKCHTYIGNNLHNHAQYIANGGKIVLDLFKKSEGPEHLVWILYTCLWPVYPDKCMLATEIFAIFQRKS